MRPEFSPEMLRLFVRAREIHSLASRAASHPSDAGAPAGRETVRDGRSPLRPAAGRVAYLDGLRKAAGVTRQHLNLAIDGRLNKAAPRLKLWGAMGCVPADHGITLTDDGGQQ